MENMCTFMEPSASSQYPVGNYMFKITIEILEKDVKYIQS